MPNCRKNHAMSDADIQARAKQDQIESNKEHVRQQLIHMREQCAVCMSSTDGTVAACLKGDSRHCCYSCHIVVAITISKLHSTTDR